MSRPKNEHAFLEGINFYQKYDSFKKKCDNFSWNFYSHTETCFWLSKFMGNSSKYSQKEWVVKYMRRSESITLFIATLLPYLSHSYFINLFIQTKKKCWFCYHGKLPNVLFKILGLEAKKPSNFDGNLWRTANDR